MAKDSKQLEMEISLEKQISQNRNLNTRLLEREAVIDLLTSELRNTQHLLEESRESYGDLYDFAPVGYITINHDGIIEETNATFVGMMGIDQRTVLRSPFGVFLASKEDLDLFLEHMSRCRREGTKINTELKLKHRTGAVLDVQLSSVPSADYPKRAVVYRTGVIDITDRKQAERAREESRRQLQLIIDAAPVPIGYLDRDQRFVFVNAEYLHKFSLQQQEVLGHTFTEVHRTAAEVLFGDRFEKGIAGVASEFEGEVTCHRSGDEFFLRVNIAPDCDPGSAPCGIIIVATDLTYQRRLLQEAQNAKQSAENASNAKSQFLSNMSHELRTPMNGILGTLQLVLEGYAEPLQSRQRELLTKSYDAGKSLLRILNDLLDMSRIEAGTLSIEQESMCIRQCAQEGVELFADKAQKKGINLTCSIADEVPLQVWGDYVRLQQVLINLIDNALKFTEQGSVMLEISAGPGSDDRSVEIFFRISDTGIGISPDKKDLLFKPLSQLDESHTRRYGGIGSGLPISENIIRMMGGAIDIESSVGSGSSFSFSIPFRVEAVTQEPAPLQAEEVPVAAPVNHYGKVRILVAEDDVLAGEILGKVLEIEGFEWDVAHDGQEAISKWENNDYGLIIMDVQMPKMDGLTATSIIREKENAVGKHTPIVAITAYANKEDEDYCLKIGMDAFLPKPLDLKKGLQVITCLVQRGEQMTDCSAFQHNS